jgi:hypothetical protein
MDSIIVLCTTYVPSIASASRDQLMGVPYQLAWVSTRFVKRMRKNDQGSIIVEIEDMSYLWIQL